MVGGGVVRALCAQTGAGLDYRKALEYIDSIRSYGIVPGLDSIRELCRRLGNPQDALRYVHIAGTNGKGSVLAYISTVLQCAGYRVGRYSSPALGDHREIIQVNGRLITKKAFCEGLELVKGICGEMVEQGWNHPTPFEVETAIAFWYFCRQSCDIVVLEAGMGGLGDATNLVTTTQVAVLASIGYDHIRFLGDTLSEIAFQKAGIIKPGCRVVSMAQEREAMDVIGRVAAEQECPLEIADAGRALHVKYGIERQSFDYGGRKKLVITMAGRFQIDNAVLAVSALDALAQRGYPVPEKALYQGLRDTRWPGRFSVIGRHPLFVADGAHNEDAARKLADSVEIYFTNKRIIYIMGMLRDKDYKKVIALTHGYAAQIITVTPPDNPRALSALELAQEIVKVHPDVTAAGSLEEAVEMGRMLAGRDDVILAFGSLSYLGRLMEIVADFTRKGGD